MNAPAAPRHGMSGHQSARSLTVEWLTPPEVLAALGPFDLDPCAPVQRPWPMAARHFTVLEDGLAQPWEGRVWLNPPYQRDIGAWLWRLAEHGNGMALVFARTETEAFHRWAWPCASAMHFFRGRLHFHHPDGQRARQNAGAPSVLLAYGRRNAERLRACALPGHYLEPRPPFCRSWQNGGRGER